MALRCKCLRLKRRIGVVIFREMQLKTSVFWGVTLRRWLFVSRRFENNVLPLFLSAKWRYGAKQCCYVHSLVFNYLSR